MLLDMFLVFFEIGLFSFGGGYAAMPLIQSLVVEQKAWLSMQEFADLTTIAEMTPGPIMVNAATFTGQKLAGFLGSIVCTIGCILPSFLIVLLLAYIYTRFRNLSSVKTILKQLRPAVVAMIASAGMTIFCLAVFETGSIFKLSFDHFQWIEALIFIACFYLLRKKKVGPIQVIFSSAIVGTILYLIF